MSVLRVTGGIRGAARSAGDMKYGVDLTPVEAGDQAAGVLGGNGGEVHVPTSSLLDHFGHDRQRAVGSGADDQSASTPGQFLVGRQGCVSELVAESLRGLLVSF